MADQPKDPYDLAFEALNLRAGKKADLDRMLEKRRSLLAELDQLDQKIGVQENLIRMDEAAAKRYARELAAG